MAIRTKCPSCQATLSVADAATGKSVRCPSCQHVFKIPAPGPSSAASTPPTASTPPAARTRAAAHTQPAASAQPAARAQPVSTQPPARVASSGGLAVKCPSCQATLRVPVGSQGKAITCPRCQKQFRIPGARTVASTAVRTAPRVAAAVPSAPLGPPSSGPLDDFDFGDLSTASPPAPQPYGAPAHAFATANPYAPRGAYATNFGPKRRSEALYIVPGVIILLWSLLLIGIAIFRVVALAIVLATNEIRDGAIPYIGGVVLGTIFITVISGAMIVGSINMIRRTGLSNARAAAILALIPCFGGLVFPIGIWATVLLYSGSVKEDFSD